MKRIVLGILAAAGVLSTIALLPQTTTSASDGTEEVTIDDGNRDTSVGGIVAALEKAEQEIQDEDLKQYYRTLVDSYDLDETTGTESIIGLADSLPDIDHIVQTAIETPLQEAGKTITDPDLKAFYYDFLEDAGFTIDKEQVQ